MIAIIAIACGLAALFGVLRRTAGLAFETEGPFRLCLACVPVNMTTLAGVIALPVRTVVVADAWRSMQAARLVLIASATAGVIFLLLSGLLRHARATNDRRPILALAGLLAIACFPVAVLGHVGELYAHTAIFWFALLCAIALDGWRRTSPAAARMRPFLTSAIATAYVFSLGLGLRANLTDMRETGVRASAWLARYANRLASLPTGSVVLFRGPVPAKAPAEFSLYRLTTPEQLVSIDALDHVLGHRVGLLLEWDGDERGQLWTSASKNDRAYDLWRRGDALLLQPARSATLARRGALSSR